MCPRTSCTPGTSNGSRTRRRTLAGRNARHNVAFLDVTFSVAKSITPFHTAFEAQEVAARRAGDEVAAAAWADYRAAVEDAIWAGNNTGLAYDALPDYLGVPDGTDVAELLDQLTVEALRP
jgi:hypothetical protein